MPCEDCEFVSEQIERLEREKIERNKFIFKLQLKDNLYINKSYKNLKDINDGHF